MPEERYIALAEVKEYLEQESKGRDFTPEQRISYDHASKIAKLSAAKARELGMKRLAERLDAME